MNTSINKLFETVYRIEIITEKMSEINLIFNVGSIPGLGTDRIEIKISKYELEKLIKKLQAIEGIINGKNP